MSQAALLNCYAGHSIEGLSRLISLCICSRLLLRWCTAASSISGLQPPLLGLLSKLHIDFIIRMGLAVGVNTSLPMRAGGWLMADHALAVGAGEAVIAGVPGQASTLRHSNIVSRCDHSQNLNCTLQHIGLYILHAKIFTTYMCKLCQHAQLYMQNSVMSAMPAGLHVSLEDRPWLADL